MSEKKKNGYQIIDKYKDQIESHLNRHCTLYTTIGSGSGESPRWINYGGLVALGGKYFITFQSTQKSTIYFRIEIDREDYTLLDRMLSPVDFIWQPFKEFRTLFLTKNYPTIPTL